MVFQMKKLLAAQIRLNLQNNLHTNVKFLFVFIKNFNKFAIIYETQKVERISMILISSCSKTKL